MTKTTEERSVPDQQSCCCVCGETKFVSTYSVLEQCRSCGFFRFVPDDLGALAELYDEAYFSGNEYSDYLGESDALRHSMKRHLQQMSRVRPLEGALLEIGCAYGVFLDEAQELFTETCGIDICQVPIEYASEHVTRDVHCGDFLDYDFGDRRFDVVCLWDTIEHLTEPDQFLERAHSLLGEGGHVFLTTGDISSLNARFRGANWRQVHPPTHVSYFSRATLSHLLERVGFQVVAVETASYYHTLRNVFCTLKLRGGFMGGCSSVALRLLGERLSSRLGFWINLGDIMFVAARKVTDEVDSGRSEVNATHQETANL